VSPQSLKETGSYIINDPRGKPTPAENIAENADSAALYYGFSCHACLPSGEMYSVLHSKCFRCTLRTPTARRSTAASPATQACPQAGRFLRALGENTM